MSMHSTASKRLALACAIALCPTLAVAQSIQTIAGGGTIEGRLATAASINAWGVVVDPEGNLLVADRLASRVFRVDGKAGTVSAYAGTGTAEGVADGGPATKTEVDEPVALAVHPDGTLYVCQIGGAILRVDRDGLAYRIAGTMVREFSGDGGPATLAGLFFPYDVAVDGQKNIYIADTQNSRIRRVDATTGIIRTIAGTGTATFSGDGGPATAAAISTPEGVAVDAAGNVFIADSGNARIRRVDAASGVITTVAGSGTAGFAGDGGPATSAQLSYPRGVSVDASGRVVIADSGNHRVRRVAGGVITTVAGSDSAGFAGDGGPATAAALLNPSKVFVSGSDLLIADWERRIRRVSGATGIITTVAGDGDVRFVGDGGPATQAGVYSPVGTVFDAAGNLFIAEFGGHRIRRVDRATGTISTVVGTRDSGPSDDGLPATQATLFHPWGLAIDAGGIYISSPHDHRVRRVDAQTGLIRTIAGTGVAGYSGDGGPGTQAQVNEVYGIALDGRGNLYLADRLNARLRKLDLTTGLISTAAGNGTPASTGDGGPATQGAMRPGGVAVDAQGNLYVADFDGHRVRKVDAVSGLLSTVAGTDEGGGGGDGAPATQSRLSAPTGLATSIQGDLYITDFDAAYRVTAGNLFHVVSPKQRGFAGDGGPALDARVAYPRHVTVDTLGNVFVSDSDNFRVRAVLACRSVSPPALAAPAAGAAEVATSPSLSWQPVDGAFRYDVYLGTDTGAATLLAADQTLTSISVANLLPGTRYSWRVVAKGDPFCTPSSTATSEVRTFTTTGGCTAPGAFAPAAPAEGAAVTPPVTLTWTPASGAGSYDVYLGGSAPPPLVASGLAVTSFSPQGLVAGSTYVWNVVARASCDPAKTTASSTRSFRVSGGCTAPGAFAVTTPADGATGVASSTSVAWAASPNATAYDLYLGTEATPPLYLAGLTANSVNVTGLAAGSTYRARVVARTSCDGSLSASTPVVSFTIAGTCDAPGPTTFSFLPATVGSGQTYVVVWKDAASLDASGSYIVERSLSTSFSPLLDSQQVSRTSATFLAKGAGTVHHRVRAVAGCDPGKTGPLSDVRPVSVVAASPNVIFTVQPQAVITGLGEPLEERKTSFTLENISEAPVQILLGRLELSPSVPFFYLVDPLGGDTAFVDLLPRQPRTFDVRFSGPSNAREGTYQGLVFASSTGQGLAITPYAFVNLKVGSSENAAPEIRFCGPQGTCTATEYVAFPGFAGDDRARPPIEIDVRNPGTTPMQLGAEIGPEVWLLLEAGWNATPIAPGASRRVRLATNRSRAPAGSALPRYTYLTLRARNGQTARLLVQDNDLPRLTTGRPALASRNQRSYMVPSVVNATSRIGNTFVSRLRLSNAGSQDVQAELLFTPSGADGFDPNSVRSATVLVPKNDLVSLTDPLVQLFGLTPPIAGTLEVRADADRIGFLTVTSLVDAPARTGGTFGFQLPTLQRGEGARLGSGHVIPGITASAAYRTNLILAETTGIEETTVRIALYDSQGVKIGEGQQTVPRYGQRQISGVVSSLGGGEALSAGSIEIDVVSGGGSVAGLVTVIDNGNDDAVTYVGRPADAPPASSRRTSRRPRWALAGGTLKSVVPAIVSGFPTFPGTDKPYTFRSQMGFVAGRAQPATFRLTYVDLSTGLSHTRTVTVEPRKTVEYQNVVEQLFGVPASARSQGPVMVESDGGGILYCKVYSGTDSGSLGDTFPVVALPSEVLTGLASEVVLALDGLEQSTDASRGTRSNLILNEVLGEETTVTLSLYEAGNRTVPIAETDLTLRPLEKAQLSTVFAGVGLSDESRRKDRANVLLVMRPRSGAGLVSGVVTTIDNKTGDTKNSLMTPGGGTPATGGGSIGF